MADLACGLSSQPEVLRPKMVAEVEAAALEAVKSHAAQDSLRA